MLLVTTAALLSGCGADGISSILPFSSQSSTAAEVFAAQNRACGPIDLAPLVPDCPLNLVCFTSACEDHNECYSVCGISKTKCDLEFFGAMMSICDRSFRVGDVDGETCRSLAFSYWLAVATVGLEAFDATQETGCAQTGGAVPSFTVCCSSGGVCDQQASQTQCEQQGGRFLVGTRCVDFGCTAPSNDECADAVPICEDLAPRADTDADSGVCAGDGAPCDLQQPQCADESDCLAVENNTMQCTVVTDTRMATTDGPTVGGDCLASGEDSFQADVWYQFTAPCTGRLVARMCDRPSYDGMLAIYQDLQDPTTCSCPPTNDMLVQCDDDFCGGGSVPAIVVDQVMGGTCYTIRVGGWSQDGRAETAAQALGELNLRMTCNPETTSEP